MQLKLECLSTLDLVYDDFKCTETAPELLPGVHPAKHFLSTWHAPPIVSKTKQSAYPTSRSLALSK
jgi:hypothetical protein